METVATLPRISRENLSALLLAQPSSPPAKLAIIDVRDDGKSGFRSHSNISNTSDHIGGHIKHSTWVPSSTLDYRLPELVRTLQGKEVVVFHCALSQQRGPAAALRYLRERRRLLAAGSGRLGDGEAEGVSDTEGKEKAPEARVGVQQRQIVYVLDGGFVKWQEKHGPDELLTEKWARDIWEEGGP